MKFGRARINWNDRRLRNLFDRYNRVYFMGKLIGWRVIAATLDSHVLGECNWKKRTIRVDGWQASSDRSIRGTLLHEMAHAETHNSGHDVKFFAAVERLLEKGAPINISASEAGRAQILAGIVPRRFPLLRAKMERVEKRRAREIERVIKRENLTVQEYTPAMIIRQFKDAATELTWKPALQSLGTQYALTDETGRARDARAGRLLANAKRAHASARRNHLQDEKWRASVEKLARQNHVTLDSPV